MYWLFRHNICDLFVLLQESLDMIVLLQLYYMLFDDVFLSAISVYTTLRRPDYLCFGLWHAAYGVSSLIYCIHLSTTVTIQFKCMKITDIVCDFDEQTDGHIITILRVVRKQNNNCHQVFLLTWE